MKILDRYILTTYLKTFISVFLILILIFILQTIWLYIKELAGKDLDIIVIAKFLIYFMPKLIPLVLPLTILLASIMVFGSFAENYEFAAMKSTGISLQRAMSGLSIFIVILGFVTFLFSNNVIPWAELNSYNLRRNIAKLKPAMLLAEGQFNEVGTYNIKFADKHGDRDQYLEDITIHIKGKNGRKNATTIKSKTGELASEKDSNVLKLILLDGNYYTDISPKKTKSREKKPFAKSTFEKYIINIDLSKLNNVDFDEKSQTDKYNMLDVFGLNKTIDSLSIKRQTDQNLFSKSLFQRSGLYSKFKDKKIKRRGKDSIYTGNLLDIFNPTRKSELLDLTNKSMTSAKQIVISKEKARKNSKIMLNKHIISLHEKFALGFACIILFFVGAPLGALIRKGGIGLPMVIAILLFLTYHFIGIFATNSAKSGNLSPILASWFSSLLMLPLSIFLTRRATADKPLIEGEGIFEFLKKLFKLKKKAPELDTSVFNNSDTEYITLNTYDNNKLINIAKSYKEFGYKIIYRNTALEILNSRGITNQQLKFSGNFNNREYEQIINLKDKYEEDAKLTFVLYFISIFTSIPGAILDNNNFPKTGTTLFLIGCIIEALLIFSFIKFCISQYNYYKHTGKNLTTGNFLVYILGIPLYFIIYFFQKKEFEKDLDLGTLDAKNKKG
ncbi:LptF/LptG family permease [Flavivirga algicola]|uniref:YjgP/YjgQ family permease n=1 Tax=Flavivirga algicola TaxID=2729136 RepID=A0ABX1RTW2_9FLAO|nr:LptF/LptG family permease [Flavivirga algicola]NMH85944.1 YjgP/YjgQ family permease [Flavivirga algicola]